MRNRARSRDENGAILVLAALSIVVLLVFAALTVDLGAAWSQRRQNQSAADAGVLAAAIDAGEVSPLEPAIVNAALDYSTRNLGGSFTPDDATPAEWLNCSDPDRPDGFDPVHDTAGNVIDCISLHGNGIVRVRLPIQIVPTSFARIVGIDTIATGAFAEADRQAPSSGVRPFGVTSGIDPGEVCLRTGPVSAADCGRNEEGDFRALDIALYGDPDTGSDRICGSAKTGDRYKVNTARGADHPLIPRGADVYRLSGCSSSDAVGGVPFPNAIPTIQGIGSNLLLDALIAGTFPFDTGSKPATPALLRQGSNPKRTIVHEGTPHAIDNKPLWDYLSPAYVGNVAVRAACIDPDWNALAGATPEEATVQMSTCLKEWMSKDGSNRLFNSAILKSPRLAVVPEFVETSWSETPVDGSSNEKTILRFRAIFLNALNFSCGPAGCDIEFVPGTSTDPIIIPPPSKSLDQLTGFVLPLSLPTSKDAVELSTGVVQLRK